MGGYRIFDTDYNAIGGLNLPCRNIFFSAVHATGKSARLFDDAIRYQRQWSYDQDNWQTYQFVFNGETLVECCRTALRVVQNDDAEFVMDRNWSSGKSNKEVALAVLDRIIRHVQEHGDLIFEDDLCVDYLSAPYRRKVQDGDVVDETVDKVNKHLLETGPDEVQVFEQETPPQQCLLCEADNPSAECQRVTKDGGYVVFYCADCDSIFGARYPTGTEGSE